MRNLIRGVELEKMVSVYVCAMCHKPKDSTKYKEPCVHCGSCLMKMYPKSMDSRNPFVVDERQVQPL